MRLKLYSKLLFPILFCGLVSTSLNAQTANNYVFSTGTGTLDPMTGSTQLIGTGIDDDPSSLTNIGFTFVYEGVNYTQFSVTPDGFVKLGSPVAVAQFTNSITSTTNVPKLFPLWDDFATGTTGAVTYVVTGSAPNRVLKINWFVTIPRNTGGAANANFQAWLYETTNVIEFRYGTSANPPSASIGINGVNANNFISVTVPGNTASTVTANNTVATWPGSGTMYTFAPPPACSGTPTPGNTLSTANPVCSGVNFTLSLQNNPAVTGLTYQWLSSTDGVTYNPIGGATSSTYTTSITATTWFKCNVTCSGNTGTSNPIQLTLNPPTSCYCAAGATSTAFEKISNVTLNTINNNSSSTAGYEDFTALSTTLTAGANYTLSVSISNAFATDQVIVFADLNHDGDFVDAGETLYTSPVGVGPFSTTINIPVTATAGPTRMRVRMHDSGALVPNATSCGTSSFGQVEDYTINVFIPPCIITCPANVTVSNDANQCGAVVTYPAPTTSGACGPVTTSPASGSFFPIGNTTVVATEPGGGTCSFVVRVNDTQAPTITCPANITVNNSPGQCGAFVNFALPAASDNCPGTTVTASPASGSLFPKGTTTVTVTARDASNNTSTCTFTVTVNDVTPPTITCPANITVGNDPNLCSAVVNYSLPTFSDNCGLPGPVALSQNVANSVGPTIQIGCQAGGFNTANSYWRAYDLSTYNLAGPLTVNAVVFGIETADAAGTGTTQPVTVRLYTSAGAFPGGVRTLVATQVVNVPDQTNSLFTATLGTPAVIPANAILVVEVFTPDGRAPVNNKFFIGSNNLGQTAPCYISAADCGVPTPVTLASLGFPDDHMIINIAGNVAGPNPLTLVSGIAPGGTFPVGTTTNTYKVTDVAGNFTTCSFTVKVNDVQPPVINCPGNITVTTPVGSCTAVVNYTVTSSDNCSGVTQALQSGLASGSNFPLGVNTVTWKATDAAGNVSTCTFTVTVNDGQQPVFTTQPTNKTACSGTNVTFSAVSTNTLSYQWQQFDGTNWNNIAGATSASYTINNVNIGMNTNSFRVRITGLCQTVTSNVATLYVNTLPIVQLAADPAPVLLPTQTTTITATTNPSGGSYAWYFNNSLISGATTATLGPLGVDNIGTYKLVYTDPNGCVTTSSSIDVTAAQANGIWVYPNPNSGSFTVRYFNVNNDGTTVNVYDSRGSRIYKKSVVTGTPYTSIDIDLGGRTPSGSYLVEVVNGSGQRIAAKWISITR